MMSMKLCSLNITPPLYGLTVSRLAMSFMVPVPAAVVLCMVRLCITMSVVRGMSTVLSASAFRLFLTR